jgi:hypothetical protein
LLLLVLGRSCPSSRSTSLQGIGNDSRQRSVAERFPFPSAILFGMDWSS